MWPSNETGALQTTDFLDSLDKCEKKSTFINCAYRKAR